MKKALLGVMALWLAVGLIRAETFSAGDKLEIRWGDRWYPGEVLEVKGGQYKVRYDGYGANWDEWATTEKLRRKGETLAAAIPKATGPALAGKWKAGDRVEALSYGAWYPATVLEAGAGRWKVTYDGYSSGSDEWVTAEKLRPLRTATWKAGDRVEALSYGKWYGAKIVAAEAARWKVTYDGYSSSSDEWLTLDRIRAPGAKTEGGTDQAGRPVEKLEFAARPAGKRAGLEGAWLRVETYYWSGSLSLNNEGWFFTKEGRFSRSPSGGFAFKTLADGPARKSDGTYWIEGDKIFLQWADGSTTTEYEFARKGGEITLGGIGCTPVEGFKSGWRFDGEYEGGASIGGGALSASTTLVFRKDGTFTRGSVASISSTSAGSTISGGAQGQGAGTYAFDGHTLTLTHTGEAAQTFTVFAFGDKDAAGRPEYIYRDGTMMRRQ
jgi:hypothetical protein